MYHVYMFYGGILSPFLFHNICKCVLVLSLSYMEKTTHTRDLQHMYFCVCNPKIYTKKKQHLTYLWREAFMTEKYSNCMRFSLFLIHNVVIHIPISLWVDSYAFFLFTNRQCLSIQYILLDKTVYMKWSIKLIVVGHLNDE